MTVSVYLRREFMWTHTQECSLRRSYVHLLGEKSAWLSCKMSAQARNRNSSCIPQVFSGSGKTFRPWHWACWIFLYTYESQVSRCSRLLKGLGLTPTVVFSLRLMSCNPICLEPTWPALLIFPKRFSPEQIPLLPFLASSSALSLSWPPICSRTQKKLTFFVVTSFSKTLAHFRRRVFFVEVKQIGFFYLLTIGGNIICEPKNRTMVRLGVPEIAFKVKELQIPSV